MMWYVMVLVTQMTQGLHEGFLWYNPKFETEQECVAWAQNNPVPIIQALEYTYPNGWEIYQSVCIREDNLEAYGVRPLIDIDEA